MIVHRNSFLIIETNVVEILAGMLAFYLYNHIGEHLFFLPA